MLFRRGDDGFTAHVVTGQEVRAGSLAWSPDGTALASVSDGPSGDGVVRVFDGRTGTPTGRFAGGSALHQNPVWAPGGDAVAVTVHDDAALPPLSAAVEVTAYRIVVEAVTNAVRHAAPPMHLEIQAGDDRVTVAVADGSPGLPVPRQATADAEGGRGLPMIDLLAAETGVRPSPPGKTVWAALARH